MKKLTALALCLSILAGLCACTAVTDQDAVNFYYCRSEVTYGVEDSVIAAEARSQFSAGSDLGTLLSAYLAGPTTEGLESPFPRSTQLLSWKLRDGTLSLNFSATLGDLSGVELTIACACISRTFLELLDIEEVVISASGALLSGETYVTVTADSILYYDDGLDLLDQTYTVYYADAQRRYLIGQQIELDLTSQSELIPRLIEVLQSPPSGSGLYTAIPLSATLLGATVEDGLCTINFSQEFETNGWSRYTAQRLTLMAVVNTLTQLEEIDRVEFCIEGGLLAQYRLVTIPAALEWDDSVIGPVRTGLNEFDATLYLDGGSGQYLVPIPTRLRQTTGISQAELVVLALTGYESRNGLSSPLPGSTRVLSVDVDNVGICHIDLSESFLAQTDHLPFSVYAIVGSVCALDGIAAVRLTVNGTVPDGDLSRYFQVLTPQTEWFA